MLPAEVEAGDVQELDVLLTTCMWTNEPCNVINAGSDGFSSSSSSPSAWASAPNIQRVSRRRLDPENTETCACRDSDCTPSTGLYCDASRSLCGKSSSCSMQDGFTRNTDTCACGNTFCVNDCSDDTTFRITDSLGERSNACTGQVLDTRLFPCDFFNHFTCRRGSDSKGLPSCMGIAIRPGRFPSLGQPGVGGEYAVPNVL